MTKLSVIVPTMNDSLTIEVCIHRVLEAPPKDKEVVVVYGESKDRTEEIVGKFQNKLKVIRDDVSVGSAINTGVLNSTGEIIVYVEGHSFVANDAFLVILKAFEGHPDVGYVRFHRHVPPSNYQFNYVQKLVNFWRKGGLGMGQFRGFRRHTFFDVGGFWVFPNGWEEVDFVAKMLETKWKTMITWSKCWDYPRGGLLSVLKKFKRTGGCCSCYFHVYRYHPWSRIEFKAETVFGMLVNILLKKVFYEPIYAFKQAVKNKYLSFFPFYTVCQWAFVLGFIVAKFKWWEKVKWDERIN